MSISWYFRNCKALLLLSLTHVSSAIASVQESQPRPTHLKGFSPRPSNYDQPHSQYQTLHCGHAAFLIKKTCASRSAVSYSATDFTGQSTAFSRANLGKHCWKAAQFGRYLRCSCNTGQCLRKQKVRRKTDRFTGVMTRWLVWHTSLRSKSTILNVHSLNVHKSYLFTYLLTYLLTCVWC